MEVCINKKDWDKIINYARCSSDKWGTEIGGMAVTIQDDDDDWIIKDPVIMKQEVSGGLCELDKTKLAEYYSKMAIKYSKKNMRFCWWHSHAKMAAFWSGTDTNTIDEYEDGDLSFALVVNVKEEYKCRVSVWKPFIIHEDVELNIIDKTSGYKIPKKLEREVAELCTRPKSNYLTTTYKNGIVHNPNQAKLWGEVYKEDDKDMKISKAWEQLIEHVDELNSSFIAGEYGYEKYASKIEKANKKLKKAGIPLSVDLVSKNHFEQLLSVHAWDLIECENGYEHLDPSDALADYHSWNQSFQKWRV